MIEKEKKSKGAVMREPGYDTEPKKVAFTGIARSVEAFDNQGFRNFRILTLHIEGGTVQKIDYSDPYASFETQARLELWNDISIINLNNNWKAGETLKK